MAARAGPPPRGESLRCRDPSRTRRADGLKPLRYSWYASASTFAKHFRPGAFVTQHLIEWRHGQRHQSR